MEGNGAATQRDNPEILVDVQNISKTYGPIKALNGISFKAYRGDILGFLGPNGAGKTTAMKIITCFLDPDEGSVRVSGHDFKSESLELRKMIGYLPESAPAYGEMTTRGFLEFIADARGIEDKDQAIDRVVEMTGLKSVLHQTVETTSKGFKRRIGLAQALIHDPEVLILDEPTDGLDPNQKALIHELISSLSQNKCIILSTHILDEVERICNRVMIISQGKILEDALPDELIRRAPNHNVIDVTLAQENPSLIATIQAQPWCKEVINGDNRRIKVHPVHGENHIADVLELLKDIPVENISLHEGRLEELFRDVTKGVCA